MARTSSSLIALLVIIGLIVVFQDVTRRLTDPLRSPRVMQLATLDPSIQAPKSRDATHRSESIEEERQRRPVNESTLVVILAETRAGHLTFDSFQKHVLNPLKADLALCVSDQLTPDLNGSDPFRQHAKYIWEYPEPDDWATAFDHIKQVENSTEDWRIMLKVKDQYLGGIKDSENQHPGSGAILLFFRWFLRENLKALPEQYKRYIVTRSDQYYVADHPIVDDNSIWVPDGEDWAGITDRHMSIPRKHIFTALDVLHDFIHRPQWLHDELLSIRKDWNLERYLAWHFKATGIMDRVRRFPRVMFGVRDDSTPTRWSKGGVRLNGDGPWIKYGSEYEAAMGSTNRALRLRHRRQHASPEGR